MEAKLNRVTITENNSKYKALQRQILWNSEIQSLMLFYDNKWILLGGLAKQNASEAGDNLEILYESSDKKHWLPATIRLRDDIDVDTILLGKFSTANRWKGMVKLGRVENSTFFPLCKFSQNNVGEINGQLLLKIQGENSLDYEMYHVSAVSNAKNGSIFGSSGINVKCTLDLITLQSGEAFVGLRTGQQLASNSTALNKIYLAPRYIECWFNGWDTRSEDLIPDYEIVSGDNFMSSKVLARN